MDKTEILKMDKITLQIECKNHIKWYDIHSVIIYVGNQDGNNMLNIYLDKPENTIDYNDAYFNTNYMNYKFDTENQNIIYRLGRVPR